MARKSSNNQNPPCSIESERVILGAMLSRRISPSSVHDEVTPAEFYEQQHRQVFQAFLELEHQGLEIDFPSLTSYMQEGKVDAGYVGQLAEYYGLGNVKYHIGQVKATAMQRRLQEVGLQIHELGTKETKQPAELLDSAEELLSSVSAQTHSAMDAEVFGTILDRIHSQLENPETEKFISTQYLDIDNIFGGGITTTNLVILAARPKMGKTALAGNILLGLGLEGTPAALFSLEMSCEQIAGRIVSEATGIDHSKIKKRQLTDNDWRALYQVSDSLQAIPIYIDDTPNRSIYDIRSKARALVRQYGVRMIIVDYLTKIRSSQRRETRDQEVTDVAESLKDLARELDVAVIALAQLNRECEKRSDKRPMLSDLRESGGIEQAADDIMFLYRDEVYNTREDNPNKGIAEVIVAKQRNGPEGRVRLAFYGPTMGFRNLSEPEMRYE